MIQAPCGNRQRHFGAQSRAGPQLQFGTQALRAFAHALQAPVAMAGIVVGVWLERRAERMASQEVRS